MNDPSTEPDPPADQLVTTTQEHQVRYWAARLACTPAELIEAADAVGRSVGRLRNYLRSRPRPAAHGSPMEANSVTAPTKDPAAPE